MNESLAFFITFTVYGTFLQGDARWWRSRGKGSQTPQPLLEHWHRDRLNHDIVLLDLEQRRAVESEVHRLSDFRGWKCLQVNARSNHVHVVITAAGLRGTKVREQVKANCTRVLRERWPVFQDRPVWSAGGDWKCINTEDELEQIVSYAGEVQDRKDQDA